MKKHYEINFLMNSVEFKTHISFDAYQTNIAQKKHKTVQGINFRCAEKVARRPVKLILTKAMLSKPDRIRACLPVLAYPSKLFTRKLETVQTLNMEVSLVSYYADKQAKGEALKSAQIHVK